MEFYQFSSLEEALKEKLITMKTYERVKIAKSYIEKKYKLKKQDEEEKKQEWQQIISKLEESNFSKIEKDIIKQNLLKYEGENLRNARKKNSIYQFESLAIIGRGAFGEVRVCRVKDSGEIVAVKKMKKVEMHKKNQVLHVKAEQEVLSKSECPWIVELKYSFQDDDYLYLVMEFLPGGDLMSLLMVKDILPEEQAKLYTAEMVLAIEAVHKLKCIHRDIKPDNVLIDSEGHIKLSDFGLSRQADSDLYKDNPVILKNAYSDIPGISTIAAKYADQYNNRKRKRIFAFSTVGTPDYIAPEVFSQTGYGPEVDWWSLGVILFEMIVGYPPFFSDSPTETCKKIMNWKQYLKFPPESRISSQAKDIIRKLVNDVDKRIGFTGSNEIKQHPFFEGLDWDNLKKEKVMFKPDVKHEYDTKYFDKFDEEESFYPKKDEVAKPISKDICFIDFDFDRKQKRQGLLALIDDTNFITEVLKNECNNSNLKRSTTISKNKVKNLNQSNIDKKLNLANSNINYNILDDRNNLKSTGNKNTLVPLTTKATSIAGKSMLDPDTDIRKKFENMNFKTKSLKDNSTINENNNYTSTIPDESNSNTDNIRVNKKYNNLLDFKSSSTINVPYINDNIINSKVPKDSKNTNYSKNEINDLDNIDSTNNKVLSINDNNNSSIRKKVDKKTTYSSTLTKQKTQAYIKSNKNPIMLETNKIVQNKVKLNHVSTKNIENVSNIVTEDNTIDSLPTSKLYINKNKGSLIIRKNKISDNSVVNNQNFNNSNIKKPILKNNLNTNNMGNLNYTSSAITNAKINLNLNTATASQSKHINYFSNNNSSVNKPNNTNRNTELKNIKSNNISNNNHSYENFNNNNMDGTINSLNKGNIISKNATAYSSYNNDGIKNDCKNIDFKSNKLASSHNIKSIDDDNYIHTKNNISIKKKTHLQLDDEVVDYNNVEPIISNYKTPKNNSNIGGKIIFGNNSTSSYANKQSNPVYKFNNNNKINISSSNHNNNNISNLSLMHESYVKKTTSNKNNVIINNKNSLIKPSNTSNYLSNSLIPKTTKVSISNNNIKDSLISSSNTNNNLNSIVSSTKYTNFNSKLLSLNNPNNNIKNMNKNMNSSNSLSNKLKHSYNNMHSSQNNEYNSNNVINTKSNISSIYSNANQASTIIKNKTKFSNINSNKNDKVENNNYNINVNLNIISPKNSSNAEFIFNAFNNKNTNNNNNNNNVLSENNTGNYMIKNAPLSTKANQNNKIEFLTSQKKQSSLKKFINK